MSSKAPASKPRIMLVGPWPPTTGGVTTFMLNVAQSALAERYVFIPFTTSRPPKHGLANVRGYGAMFRGGLGQFLFSASVTLGHAIAFPFALLSEAPDAVQIQASDYQAFWETAYYVALCRMMRRPVLMRIGGSFDDFYNASSLRAQAMIRRVLSWPDRLIVQADRWRDFVAGLGRADGVSVVPNSIADTLAVPVEHAGGPVPTCLFLAGSEASWKGVADVIAAIHLLKGRGVSVRFRILAASNDLKQLIAGDGLGNMAEAEGFLDRQAVLAAMREADIFLLPSYGEGFPNSLIEAMASGLAAIVTPVGAVPEIVGAGGAVTVPVKNPEALANAIARLAGDAALRRKISDAGRAIVTARYTHSVVMPKLDAAWQSLLERPQ